MLFLSLYHNMLHSKSLCVLLNKSYGNKKVYTLIIS